MKRNIILFFVILCCSLVFTGLQANNIQISNVKIGSDNTTGGYAVITFDLSWENSWRSSSAPGNWDAAWLFVKYRNSCGEWQHARLGNTGHTAGTGTQAVIEPGLMDVSGSFNSISNPVVGCLVYRSSSGNGNFTSRGMQLRWDYSSNGLSTVNASDIRVFGLEMVYCPEGSFFVGDGVSTYALGQVSGGTPVQVTPAGVILRSSGANDRDDDTLEGGIWVDGDGGISRSSASETDMNDKFPTGYRGFYMMKYETSQGQYRDFLNTLSRSQQNERTATDISGTSVTNRFVMSGSSQLQNRNGIRCDAALPASGSVEFYCDLDGDGIRNEPGDGQWLACNFINWSDAMAFSDWCGLRPATELEYEKGCRGPDMSVAGEYSWASATVATSAYSLSGAGSGSEGIAGNYSMSGNALFSATSGSISGPARVGITASHASNSGRTSSGSGYYGAMELSGNLSEQVVSLATLAGRNYTGEHGNGLLDAVGNANVPLWPAASGGGSRGGGWLSAAARLRVSDRGNTTEDVSSRRSDGGCRGARTAVRSTVSTLLCGSATASRRVVVGINAAGTSLYVPYSGGNGGALSGQTVTSSGVSGLTATLLSGNLADGSGNLAFTLSGTPAQAGTAVFGVNLGGQSCSLSLNVAVAGSVADLSCSEAVVTGMLSSGLPLTGVSFSLPYSGGNGGVYGGQSVVSTGITGLTATLSAGDLATGSGNLIYSVAGTPSGAGLASFLVNAGGKSCTVQLAVSAPGIIGSIGCSTAVITGTLASSQAVSGVSASVPYTGGNGGQHNGQTVTSTGVTGLTATLTPGTFANGGGNLTYTITGTPAGAGTASFALNIGGKTCSLSIPVSSTGSIESIGCGNISLTGSLMALVNATGVSAVVPYTGGNGGQHNGQTVISTVLTGLTATLSPGLFANGSGNLTYTITGSTLVGGTASFALNIGGQTCTLNVTVAATVCRAKINATDYKNFMCYNLGAANTQAEPFTPSWEINGGYWQWGRKEQAAAGPSGPGSSQANDGEVSGWNTSGAPIGAWSDASKTANDPCPAGYRVPTYTQWYGVSLNNTMTFVGNFNSSATNYGAGIKFGNQLMLPASGYRSSSNGMLPTRGGDYNGYWSSSRPGGSPWYLDFSSSSAAMITQPPTIGGSIRCVAEDASIGSIDCGNASVIGSLMALVNPTGVGAVVPYTGGNGGQHNGQTVTSTGVTGLTATLTPGTVINGSGNLTYTITGTPAGAGMASFALNIGGQTCTLNVTVAATVCRAKINATDYKNFMCHNLGAANTSAEPFTPSWEINGGYWQWGRKDQAAAGPSGPGSSQANDGEVSGWNTSGAPDGAWSDASKTANDPCPAGYRVPTKLQWDGVVANNTITNVGTFSNSATNYGAGRKFGDQLMLPAAGYKRYYDGALGYRGDNGLYWSSSGFDSGNAWRLIFGSSIAGTNFDPRTYGESVRCVADTPGAVGAINCSGTTITGTLTSGQAASGVSASVPYTGGNGGFHTGQTVTSTGVTGLTATLSAGSFVSGVGSLSYTITGTPAGAGTASFALNIGGQTCTLNVTVAATVCRAKINVTDYKNFMCHNLGAANTSADPFTPSWEINGGYWQWGRSAEAAAGPTVTDPKSSAVSGWNTTNAANGSWADGSKTGNDPCPAGYRVPTKAQWDGVVANNTLTNVGSFSDSATNYGAGKKFGDQLMLPAAGLRNEINGALFLRGNFGNYWSSTENVSSSDAWSLLFLSSIANAYSDYRSYGLSVRCVAEDASIGSIDCGNASVIGSLMALVNPTGVGAVVPYTGGNGGQHNGQTVTSTGVTGLTATLTPGTVINGSGNLTYTITGTPAGAGTASFALNIGGQTCTLNVTVAATVCRAKINATDYKNFMCHNLGAANTSADPFTPSWEINGGYWQWGRSAEAAAGPTVTDPKSSAVSGWNPINAANGSWADGSKTGNDPCPAGYRVPTKAQWDGVVANNTLTNVGSFSNSATNYGAGKKFGDQLMLPAAGYRYNDSGALDYRGNNGNYWSSTEIDSSYAWYLYFNSSNAFSINYFRPYGNSVRCVAE